VFLGLAAHHCDASHARWRGRSVLVPVYGGGFVAVYVRQPGYWWALIPCGVLFTLAVIVALPQAIYGTAVAAVLFLGLAGTFGVLSLVPVRTSGHTVRLTWPLFSAAGLGPLGMTFALQSTALIIPTDFAVPAVVILAGIALLVFAFRARDHGPRTH
jgi:hypothetical protein